MAEIQNKNCKKWNLTVWILLDLNLTISLHLNKSFRCHDEQRDEKNQCCSSNVHSYRRTGTVCSGIKYTNRILNRRHFSKSTLMSTRNIHWFLGSKNRLYSFNRHWNYVDDWMLDYSRLTKLLRGFWGFEMKYFQVVFTIICWTLRYPFILHSERYQQIIVWFIYIPFYPRLTMSLSKEGNWSVVSFSLNQNTVYVVLNLTKFTLNTTTKLMGTFSQRLPF